MNKEDKKLQKHLVDEMMKVSKTNPDVMIYMQALMENYEKLEQEIDRLNNIIKNYEINTIPTLEHNIDVLVDSEDRLNNIINETLEYAKYQLKNFDFYEDTKAKMFCAMIITMLDKELKENNNDKN